MHPAPAIALAAPELADIRTLLVEDLSRPPHENPAFQVFQLHAAAGIQVPADPSVLDPGRQAALLVGHELTRLRNADLFWISPKMTRMALATAPAMPAFLPRRDDLPAEYGLIYFAVPVGDYNPWPSTFIYADGTTFHSAASERRYQVCAASWGPWDQCGRWAGGGTWFTFYTTPKEGQERELADLHGLTGDQAARLAAMLPPLRIDNEAICPASASDLPPGLPPLEDDVRNPESTTHWMHLVLCAFRLMATARSATVTDEPAARPARKRARRAHVTRPDAPVRLVDIAVAPERSQPGGQEQGDQEKRSRKYDRWRWRVNGHWRNQYYPSLDAHRPVFIEEYTKGLEGRPFKEKKVEVNVLRLPGEPTRRPRPAQAPAVQDPNSRRADPEASLEPEL